MWWAVCQQIALLVLAVLSFGHLSAIFSLVAVAYWAGVISIMARRSPALTKGDVYYFKFGLLLLTLSTFFALPLLIR